MSAITVPRDKLEQALEALEIGYESASAEAAQYHAAMAGYRPERHAAMDADVEKIAKAITTFRDALAQPEPPEYPDEFYRAAYESACALIDEQDKMLKELEELERQRDAPLDASPRD